MSIIKDIKDELITLLTIDPTLNSYLSGGVLQGMRNNVTIYPVIIYEPETTEELEGSFDSQTLIHTALLHCITKVENKDEQVNEILTFENNVKFAISSDRRLNDTAILISFGTTQYDGGENYPLRGFTIPVLIQFKQDTTTRL